MKFSLHWVALAVSAALIGAVFAFVDLRPHVDEGFFFAADNPAFHEAQRIGEMFPADEQIILAAGAPDIHDEAYLDRVHELTEALEDVPGVNAVKSVTQGPDDVEDAEESPLWRRLLIAQNGSATLLLLLVDVDNAPNLIADVESVAERIHDDKTFRVRISGAPYITEMIRRDLVRDFRRFSGAAIGVFAVVIFIIFRSLRITFGAVAACGAAVALTLIIQQLLGMRIGLLTANLATIVFVLTLSHVVFMTGNWRTCDGDARQAWRMTLTASVWCMLTTLLGFASLLLVDAQPLRELGAGGAIGTACAMACAYLLYPPILAWTPASGAKKPVDTTDFWRQGHLWPAADATVLIIAATCGIAMLNTDPSLLSYFNDGSDLRDGLAYIDRNGGSSPLKIVIRTPVDQPLNTSDAYERMWKLQLAIEQHEAVGTVISLPVLMAEADRSPLSMLLSWERVLEIMEKPKFNRVARSFVTEDRTQALFLLRMVESQRDGTRLDVIGDLKQTVREHGYEPALVGGVYALQGHLARLVSRSLLQGLAALAVLFFIIACIVARSPRGAGAMTIAAALVPAAILGAVGWLTAPLDVISAPAANVCVGMAVDAMIHLTRAARRHGHATSPDAWAKARSEQWRSVVIAAAIVCIGFAIFGLSSFPPTRRFGLAVVFGTVIAALAALLILPLLASGKTPRGRGG